MKPITQEWIEKADRDFAAAQLLLDQPKPSYDLVCFHSQQCAEKYLKACLQESDIFFPKTHDLSTLLDLLLAVQPAWESMRFLLKSLTAYAVEFRYPGVSATEILAKQAVRDCMEVRQVILRHLKQANSDNSQCTVTDTDLF
jgi:HEPN domain-containing protein